MDSIFNLLTKVFISTAATITLLNPFDATWLQKPALMPTPTVEMTATPVPTNYPTTKNSPPKKIMKNNTQLQIKQEAKPLLTAFPTLILDSDPLVICTSKTGNKSVKRSICNNYTDCPDGYGGYVFESQEACKKRWQSIGNDLKNVNEQYIKALQEQQNLYNQKRKLDQDQYNREFQQKLQQQTDETNKFTSDLESKTRAENQRILQEQSDYFKNLIKEPSPTPTPQQGGGRLLDPYHTSY